MGLVRVGFLYTRTRPAGLYHNPNSARLINGFFACTQTRPVGARRAREPRPKITNKEIGKNPKAQIITVQHFPGNFLGSQTNAKI